MGKRHDDALGIINPGASNPSGICRSIIDACQEVHNEGGSTQRDPAIRLMVHQLANVCRISELDLATQDFYGNFVRLCHEHVETDKAVSRANALVAGRAS